MRHCTGGILSYKWNTIQAILSSYETNKITYAEWTNSILFSSPSPPDMGSHRRTSNTSDTTGDKATQLNSPFMVRLLGEIIAVETALENMDKVKKEFVKQYFFEGRLYINCEIKVKLKKSRKVICLSVRTLKRKCVEVVNEVSVELAKVKGLEL